LLLSVVAFFLLVAAAAQAVYMFVTVLGLVGGGVWTFIRVLAGFLSPRSRKKAKPLHVDSVRAL
jgi:uncharacterized membrane protein